MKNNFIKNTVYALLTVTLISVNNAAALNVLKNNIMSSNISKIGITMGGIFIFMFLMYLGLTIYNKFFVPQYLKDPNLYKDSLNSPADKEGAIKEFIYKNRLK